VIVDSRAMNVNPVILSVFTARALKVREETIFWARHDRDEAGYALVLKEPVPELGPGRQRR